MPTPAEAAAILRAHFGMVQDPADPNVVVGDPTGSVALAGARGSQASELEDRIANETSALAMPPREGYVQGEPGRRTASYGMTPANLVADRLHLNTLRGEQAADPFTGDAETARVGGVQKALDAAALTQRPEIGDAADTVAKRNAFAEFLKSRGIKMGEYEAASSPAAQAAAMVPITAQASDVSQGIKDKELQRAQALKRSPSLVPGQVEDGAGGYTLPPNYKPLSAAENNRIESMAGVAPMLGDLKAMLDPTLNVVTNKAAQSIRMGLYNMGIPPSFAGLGDAKAQARIQMADLIKIMGASPFMAGSRNYKYMQDVYRHLTNPAATDAFLYNTITELEKRWPQIQQAIIQTHIQPGTPLDFRSADERDPWAAPPTADELKR
jgi:hypothetical protein